MNGPSPDRQSPETPEQPARTTTVRIFGTEYAIRSHEDAEYIRKVAESVDAGMHRIARNRVVKSTADIAVLAAMNLADELFRTRRQLQDVLRRVGDTTDALAQVVEKPTPPARTERTSA